MPITSPSYFPPASGLDQVRGTNAGQLSTGAPLFLAGKNAGKNSTTGGLIIIGDTSGNGGITGSDLVNAVIIGNSSWESLAIGDGNAIPITSVGANIANLANGVDSSVFFGSQMLNAVDTSNAATISNAVFVGNNIYNSAKPNANVTSTVVIGSNIVAAVAGNSNPSQSVVIGTNILNAAGPQTMSNSVLIGNGITGSASAGQIASTIAIGGNNTLPVATTGNVIIGLGAGSSDGGAAADENNIVAIGTGVTFSAGGGFHVLVGYKAINPANAGASFGCVCIGANAGSTVPATIGFDNLLVIESSTTLSGGSGNTPSTLVYGQFTTGNLIFGNSVAGTNRDFGGTGVGATNIHKLVNGTKSTGGNPVGGGYFYVSAGSLHWVGSSGTDTALAVA